MNVPERPGKMKSAAASQPLWRVVVLVLVSSGLFGLLILPKIGPRAGRLNSMAVDFSLPLLEQKGGPERAGSRFSLAAARGKVVLLDFWATWCGPCLEQAKTLERFAAVHGKDVVVVGVDEGERAEVVAKHLASHPAAYSIALDEDEQVGQGFGVRGLPTLVVIDKAGRIASITSGLLPYARLERILAEAEQ